MSQTPFRVAVIVPTHNDAHLLEGTLESIRAAGAAQVLVIDGGSTDATLMVARRCGVKVCEVPAEQGQQLRFGAASASGDVLMIVPPGVRLRPDALMQVSEALADSRVLAGVLDARFTRGLWRGTLLNGVYFLLRSVGFTAAGSAIFVWRTACGHGQNFRSLRVFAELDLLRRLAHKGRIARLADAAEMTPAHELHRFMWTLLELPYRLRIPPRMLGWFYRKPTLRSEAPTDQASAASDLRMST